MRERRDLWEQANYDKNNDKAMEWYKGIKENITMIVCVNVNVNL